MKVKVFSTLALLGLSLVALLNNISNGIHSFMSSWVFIIICLVLLLAFSFLLKQKKPKSLPKKSIPTISKEDKHTITLAQSIVHDIKEPLRSIQVYSNLLHKEGILTEDNHKDYLEEIIHNTTRLNHFLHNFLEFSSSLESQSDRMKYQKLEDAYILAKNNLFGLIKEKNAILHYSSSGSTMCYFEFSDFVRIFQNLLSNGIKYCPEDRVPKIKISIHRLATCIQIKVEDNGIGLDTKNLELLTRPFYRHHQHSGIAGTGLGLSIVHNLVIKHHGKLSYYNNSECGAVFEIFMPIISSWTQKTTNQLENNVL